MTNSAPFRFSDTLVRLALESSRRSSGLHRQFLAQREVSLGGMKSLIELQIRAAGGTAAPVYAEPGAVEPACVFTSAQLDAFGTGRISDCLGPHFARYDSRRMPRIPNGDLKMMSRVTAISGRPGDFTAPASIEVAYDVPADSWYLRDNAGVEMPFSLVMETALQPCGFLMAYLDTFGALGDGEYYFRNLDGWIKVDRRHAIAGRQLLTRARMISSVNSAGTLMQKFAFELSCDGQPFCHGETLFGYFPAAAMASQAGLDGGKMTPTWKAQRPELDGAWIQMERAIGGSPQSPRYRLSGERMSFLDNIYIEKNGGRYGKGYIYGERSLRPDDWFYPFHFHQDPVMPGSLGVEAILQGMQAFALEGSLGQGLRSPRFGLAENLQTQWRYRGQILQTNRKMEIEAHINSVQDSPSGAILTGDASLWADGLRIYEVKNAAVGIHQE